MKNDRRRWVRTLLSFMLLFVSVVGGCTRSSDQGLSWEEEQAMGSEAYQQGRYTEAEIRWTSALKKAEKFEPEDPRLATSLDRLALLASSQSKYADAESLYQRALAIREKALGPIHPDVAKTLYNLAKLYQAQGTTAKAEPLYQRALAIHEKMPGQTHPDKAMILENYVTFLRKANRADEAAAVLAIHSKGDRSKSSLPICPD